MNRKKQWFIPAVCILGSLVLFGILKVAEALDKGIVADGKILREGYAGEEEQYELLVEGLEKEPVPVSVVVSPRADTKEEADTAFYNLMDQIAEKILGENESLSEVEKDLKLITSDSETGIELRWQSSNPEIISSAGKVMMDVASPQMIVLHVRLLADGYRGDFELPIRVVPRSRQPEEAVVEQLKREITKRNEQQKTEEYLVLPEIQNGKQISYRKEKRENYGAIPVLGILLGVLFMMREREREKEKDKKRERELLMDYAEVVSKLMILVGAGMTIRGAWERMVKDYENGKEKGTQEEQAAGEEMCRTYYQIVNGMPEGTAYREFGRRCKLQPYLKFSSVLEQNRKAGTKNLRAILRTEMEDAFEMRKNLARRMGEEAGTKLLAPLFLMLGIVMIMIMAPAMMSMG